MKENSNGTDTNVGSMENSIEERIEEKYTRYLNCETDILDLTLEEAKFILETNERRNYVTSILQEAGKVILSDYKRVLKENEELKEEVISVQKVKDKIEEYKNMLKTCNKSKDIDRIKAINERILELQDLLEGRK